ncbi:MAG: potassium/proton antiporter [Planctomycetota bacterium]|nr:MAG: potassium/proton antiporter [Planctomycetota bacterium]
MFLIDWIILLTGMMLVLGIASSKLSARLGLPVLVLFLALGMLAGSEGIGGIEFEDYALAHAIGTFALVVILFDGGLGTPMAAVREVWKPALVLAAPGVLFTAIITGAAASWILQLPFLEGLLLGSIVGSTDASAVFAVLRAGGVSLAKRLQSMLELESGSNDPMAIFLTVGFIEVITGKTPLGVGLLGLFASQMIVGAVIGIGIGSLAVRAVNRINLDSAGLYPVLVAGFGLLTFGVAVWLGGSGFLAVYLAGIVIGNRRLVFQRGIRLFHDAAAWLSQIVMFVVLGLLSFPSRLIDVAPQGLLIGAVLIFLARPLAVAPLLLPFRFSPREVLFISWVGLKGAVPITLATFPLLFGTPAAAETFDVVFFVVVLSALVQGWSLPPIARWLGLETMPAATPPVTLEISSLQHVDGDIVDYAISPNSRAAGRTVKQLALPAGVVIALVSRDDNIVPPHGSTRLEAGDHVIVVLKPGVRPLVDRVFASPRASRCKLPTAIEFPLRGTTTVAELRDMYGVEVSADPQETLSAAMRRRLGDGLSEGAVLPCGEIALRVRKIAPGGVIEQIGMILEPQCAASDAMPGAAPRRD